MFITIRYHWAFLIGPKLESQAEVPGVKYHVKNTPFEGWAYEEIALQNVKCTAPLLTRVLIAKVKDEGRLIKIFRDTPIVQNNAEWRCRTWIADALRRISEDGGAVATAILDWAEIERFARDYVAKKSDEGRYGSGQDMLMDKPTWDMIGGKELIS